MKDFLRLSKSVTALARDWPSSQNPQSSESMHLENSSDAIARSPQGWKAVFMEGKPLRESSDREMDKNVPQAAAQAFAG